MGYTIMRVGKDGTPHWTACYRDLKGRVRSAGTFTTEKRAIREWHRKEEEIRQGRTGDPTRGRMKFQRYVEDTWLPNHVMEATTRQSYTYAIYKHIIPEFGTMRMIDIQPDHVQQWITILGSQGMKPATIKSYKIILTAIFTTAFHRQVLFFHPCAGVKVPTVVPKPLAIITPEQFDAVYHALPNSDAQLLVETDIESGLRWGELTELRVKDLDFHTGILTVSRAVTEVNTRFHPTGGRFLVKLPKDNECRSFKLSAQIVNKLQVHRDAKRLGSNDLLFAIHEQGARALTLLGAVPSPDELGLTSPNEKGRQYKHGTLSGYGAGRCRCEHCTAACNIYRAKRRAAGKDNPRGHRIRQTDEDGHISAQWFRQQVWYPAVAAAGLEHGVRIHDLRHAHASWLLAGGADLQVVKERLGHASIVTTERYLHTLPEADETALTALSNIRAHSTAT